MISIKKKSEENRECVEHFNSTIQAVPPQSTRRQLSGNYPLELLRDGGGGGIKTSAMRMGDRKLQQEKREGSGKKRRGAIWSE